MPIPWIFFAVAVIGAWFTWNAYRPIYRPAPLAVLSFFAGWLTAELAIHHILWQVAVTAVFVWAGALAAWPGVVGLGITLVSWVALARCVWQTRRWLGRGKDLFPPGTAEPSTNHPGPATASPARSGDDAAP